jgi:hypothetical protein
VNIRGSRVSGAVYISIYVLRASGLRSRRLSIKGIAVPGIVSLLVLVLLVIVLMMWLAGWPLPT